MSSKIYRARTDNSFFPTPRVPYASTDVTMQLSVCQICLLDLWIQDLPSLKQVYAPNSILSGSVIASESSPTNIYDRGVAKQERIRLLR